MFFFKASSQNPCKTTHHHQVTSNIHRILGEALKKNHEFNFLEAKYQKKLSRGVWNLYGVNLREIYIELSTTTRPQ